MNRCIRKGGDERGEVSVHDIRPSLRSAFPHALGLPEEVWVVVGVVPVPVVVVVGGRAAAHAARGGSGGRGRGRSGEEKGPNVLSGEDFFGAFIGDAPGVHDQGDVGIVHELAIEGSWGELGLPQRLLRGAHASLLARGRRHE